MPTEIGTHPVANNGIPSAAPKRFLRIYRELGFKGFLFHILYRFLRLPTVTIRLRSKDAIHPLYCRMGTSDILVFRQIFTEREYRCFDDLIDPLLVIDCGANVGYSSSYFLSRFPTAFVIAVEPESGNFEVLKKNLAPYVNRFLAVRSAIWSKRIGMSISNAQLGGPYTSAWGFKTHEARAGEAPQIEATTIGDLLESSREKRISILKIDIEGSEAEVFGNGFETWLPKVDNMAIELHGETCRKIFDRAIAAQDFAVSASGELTVCKRR